MKKVILTIFSVKVSIFLLMLISFAVFPFSKASYLLNFHYSTSPVVSQQTAFSTWDAQHYLYLAAHGYSAAKESDRFFPLFPFLIHIFASIFGLLGAGLFVSFVASTISFLYFYIFVKERYASEDIAYKSLLALLIFPTSFFFSLVYSESLLFLLSIACVYYIYKKNFIFASLLAFFIPLTRPTGIFIMVPFAFYILRDYWNNVTGIQKEFFKTHLPFRSSVLLFVAPVMGSICYLWIMNATTGNIFSGLSYLSGDVILHWNFLQTIFSTHLSLHDPANSVLDRIFFIFFLCLLPVVWRRTDKFLFSYTIVMGLIPLSESFMSYTRYMLMVFPLFIVLGYVFSRKKYSFFLYAYPALLLQALFVIMQTLNYWVA